MKQYLTFYSAGHSKICSRKYIQYIEIRCIVVFFTNYKKMTSILLSINVFSKLRNLSDEHQPTSLKWALIWGKQLESNVCFADKLFQSEWPAWHRSSAREKWAIRSAKKMGNLSKVRSLREEGIILCIPIRMFWPSNDLRERTGSQFNLCISSVWWAHSFCRK